MIRSYRLLGALMLAAVPSVAAQAPTGGAPQPGAEVKKLQFFVGRWTSTGDMKPGPMGPGGAMRVTNNCEWFQGGFHVVCRSEGTNPMGATHGLGIISYNPEHKQYVYYSIDNTGMPPDPVRGSLNGDTWLWEGQGEMGGQVINGRYTMKVVSSDEYSWTWEMQMPGQSWTTVATGSDKRVK
jgi:hypothetical protein